MKGFTFDLHFESFLLLLFFKSLRLLIGSKKILYLLIPHKNMEFTYHVSGINSMNGFKKFLGKFLEKVDSQKRTIVTDIQPREKM